MKLFLDDIRQAPNGWILITSPEIFLSSVINNWYRITEISLDHDLGYYSDAGVELTGNWVLQAILEEVVVYGRKPNFNIFVHSENPVGAARMRLTANDILKHKP